MFKLWFNHHCVIIRLSLKPVFTKKEEYTYDFLESLGKISTPNRFKRWMLWS